ncbi:adenosine kinase [Acidisoma cellulosilytica]|uniref:Adenosine kinase n=1 Tax=Acidisoma cellulosilyticum TaxID=2802395 RepID=A0A964E2W7_9PROT|nr:adenosine kinase [Acidisoma cellulosilyticum]MCB8879749.1 adenosine kinase [Acidisoma cellulosilyticum]
MTSPRYDILSIGNAIVDILAEVDEAFLSEQAMIKGSMELIDARQTDSLYALMPPAVQTSGGSVANTAAVAGQMGARAAFIGVVADDQFGGIFRHDIHGSGVHYATPSGTGDTPTARCLILVTPDGQRTMNTFLGISSTLAPHYLDHQLIADSAVIYLEGFLMYVPDSQAASAAAAVIAHAAGRRVAISLSDFLCVERNLEPFRAMVRDHIDILFANELELAALTGLDDFEAGAEAVRGQVEIAALTRGDRGSVILRGAERVDVPPVATKVVDTTGAGDAYAAGFMTALCAGESLATCGLWASRAAAETISRMGARPPGDLSYLRA